MRETYLIGRFRVYDRWVFYELCRIGKAKLIKKRSTRSRPVKKVFFLLNVAIRGFNHFLYNTTQLNSFSDTGAATRGQRVTDLPQTELK